MKKVVKVLVLLGSLLGSVLVTEAKGVYEEPVIIDNTGHVKISPYGLSRVITDYDIDDYYDCYIPYAKSYAQIGGYAIDTGLGEPHLSGYQEEVGGRLHGYASESDLSGCSSFIDEDGAKIYKDARGYEYYAIRSPRFWYNTDYVENRIDYSDSEGQLVDIILSNGEVLHCVVEGYTWESEDNGWCPTSSVSSLYSQTELICPQYSGMFHSLDGGIVSIAGKDFSISDALENKYDISEDSNKITYIRMYNAKITDGVSRSFKEKSYLYSDKEAIVTGEYTDEVLYENTSLGMGKGDVASKFTDATQKIVEDHCLDFDVTTLESFMQEKGGYESYLKSLGGIFASYAGTGVKIPVKTSEDFKLACEYTFGIICMWGFDYSNGNPSHYGRWRSGDGVTEANVTKDAFYPKGYTIPYEYKDKCAAPRDIDKIASQVDVSQKGVNTCCNYCTDLALNKMDVKLAGGAEKRPTSATIKAQRKITEKVIGKPGIYDSNELKVGDLIHCFNRRLTEAEKNNADANIGGVWGHVMFVGEVDREKGTYTVYHTGHDLTNDGDYKQTIKLGNPPSGYAGWLGTRILEIEESSEVTLDVSSSGSSSGNGSSSLVSEDKLDGMSGLTAKLSDNANSFLLPDNSSLTGRENTVIFIMRSNMKMSTQERLITWVRVFIVFMGILMFLYIVILFVAYCFDIVNVFFDISLLKLVTFGKISYDSDVDKNKMCLRRLLKYSIVLFCVGSLLVSGGVYVWVQDIYNVIRNFM